MQSSSEISNTSQLPEQMIRINVNYLLATADDCMLANAPDAALAYYTLALSLYFSFPFPLSEEERLTLTLTQNNFLNLLFNKPLIIESPFFNKLIELFNFYVGVQSIITLEPIDGMLLRNNIDVMTRHKLADIWDILGTHFYAKAQYLDAGLCYQSSLAQANFLANYNLSTLAQNIRACAHSIYFSATENLTPDSQLISILQTALAQLNLIPAQHRFAMDDINCVVIQSSLTLWLLSRANQLADNKLERFKMLEVADTENNTLTALVTTLQEQCADESIKIRLQQAKLNHQLDYLTLMKNVTTYDNAASIFTDDALTVLNRSRFYSCSSAPEAEKPSANYEGANKRLKSGQ
ncbi:MAG: hypothetical protein V4501_06755 [Pseudomonadota bacterium]